VAIEQRLKNLVQGKVDGKINSGYFKIDRRRSIKIYLNDRKSKKTIQLKIQIRKEQHHNSYLQLV
jgi:hypothetical protein